MSFGQDGVHRLATLQCAARRIAMLLPFDGVRAR